MVNYATSSVNLYTVIIVTASVKTITSVIVAEEAYKEKFLPLSDFVPCGLVTSLQNCSTTMAITNDA